LALIVMATALTSAAVAGATVRWFHSPSGNIQCEVASGGARGTYAYCQTFTPMRTARLTAHGRTKVCSRQCSVGNGPENATTLGYGRSLRIGRFRYTSLSTGMRCVVVANGHGFRIARAGVTTF
jgi:hypothetical protein